MLIDSVYAIIGRGTVILGEILVEKIEKGERIIIETEFLNEMECEINSIEQYRKKPIIAHRGDIVGLSIELDRKFIKKGMKIYKCITQ